MEVNDCVGSIPRRRDFPSFCSNWLCASVHVHVCTHIPVVNVGVYVSQHVCGDQQTTLCLGSYLPPLF